MYATCSGLPVSLKMQAASAIKMDLATNFDIESYIKHPEDSSFKFKFVPRYLSKLIYYVCLLF